MMMDVLFLLLSQLACPLPHLIGNDKLYPDKDRAQDLDTQGNFPAYDWMGFKHLKDHLSKNIVVWYRVYGFRYINFCLGKMH